MAEPAAIEVRNVSPEASPPPAAEHPAPAEPEAAPAEPEPEPAPPSPAERLLEAVRSELRMVRSSDRELVSDAQLDGLAVRTGSGATVAYPAAPATLDAAHPIVAAALNERDLSPILISFLVSATYTAINLRLREITDADEAAFHRLHAAHVATAARS